MLGPTAAPRQSFVKAASNEEFVKDNSKPASNEATLGTEKIATTAS